MAVYYNEFDPGAAEWLRNLINAGHIAPGDVDERSIEEVRPDDLRGYTQHHFFAGVGVWSYALRAAGWPDDRPVWTGSCPCQPFSAAGKGKGFADERHLWPAWHHLIREYGPECVYGEQVASKDGLTWLDLVQADMEGSGYAFGAVDLCAAGVGAPHIRQRIYFVAGRLGDANGAGLERYSGHGHLLDRPGRPHTHSTGPVAEAGGTGGLADGTGERWHGREDTTGKAGRLSAEDSGTVGRLAHPDSAGQQPGRERPETARHGDSAESDVCTGRLADARRSVLQSGFDTGDDTEAPGPAEGQAQQLERGRPRDRNSRAAGGLVQRSGARPRPTNGHWGAADWLLCRDGKWRPVEPGTFPLVDGAPKRVVRLRAYGNAIVAPLAEEFIRCSDEAMQELRRRSALLNDREAADLLGL